MKYLFFFLSFISCSVFANISKGQTIDTNAIDVVGVKIFQAFKDKSYQNYRKIVMDKSDYKNVIRKTKWELLPQKKFKEGYNFLMRKTERQFNLIIRKGEYQEIDWSAIEFEKIIFYSEETQIVNRPNPEPIGFLVHCHLVLRFKDEYYTLIGIKLLNCEGDYKIFGSPEGVYPVRLEEYIRTDFIGADKNGTN